MNPDESLRLLDKVVSDLHTSRANHARMQQAVASIHEALTRLCALEAKPEAGNEE